MPISEINALTDQLARANARDLQEQQAILDRIRLVRKELEKSAYQDLAGCVDAANLLAEYLTRMGCIGPEGILRVVTQLMRTVQRSLQEPMHAEPGEEETDQGADEAHAGGGERFRPMLTAEEASQDLRLVSDRVLGELLIDLKLVERHQVEQALSVQRATGMRIGEALVEIGAASWNQIQNALTVQASMRQRGNS